MVDTSEREYTRVFVLFEGDPLLECKSVNVRRDANSVPQQTTMKGYSGETPGASMADITVTSAVTTAGLEKESIEDALKLIQFKKITFQFEAPDGSVAKYMTFKGKIYTDTLSYNVNDHTTHDFSARGRVAFWK